MNTRIPGDQIERAIDKNPNEAPLALTPDLEDYWGTEQHLLSVIGQQWLIRGPHWVATILNIVHSQLAVDYAELEYREGNPEVRELFEALSRIGMRFIDFFQSDFSVATLTEPPGHHVYASAYQSLAPLMGELGALLETADRTLSAFDLRVNARIRTSLSNADDIIASLTQRSKERKGLLESISQRLLDECSIEQPPTSSVSFSDVLMVAARLHRHSSLLSCEIASSPWELPCSSTAIRSAVYGLLDAMVQTSDRVRATYSRELAALSLNQGDARHSPLVQFLHVAPCLQIESLNPQSATIAIPFLTSGSLESSNDLKRGITAICRKFSTHLERLGGTISTSIRKDPSGSFDLYTVTIQFAFAKSDLRKNVNNLGMTFFPEGFSRKPWEDPARDPLSSLLAYESGIPSVTQKNTPYLLHVNFDDDLAKYLLQNPRILRAVESLIDSGPGFNAVWAFRVALEENESDVPDEAIDEMAFQQVTEVTPSRVGFHLVNIAGEVECVYDDLQSEVQRTVRILRQATCRPWRTLNWDSDLGVHATPRKLFMIDAESLLDTDVLDALIKVKSILPQIESNFFRGYYGENSEHKTYTLCAYLTDLYRFFTHQDNARLAEIARNGAVRFRFEDISEDGGLSPGGVSVFNHDGGVLFHLTYASGTRKFQLSGSLDTLDHITKITPYIHNALSAALATSNPFRYEDLTRELAKQPLSLSYDLVAVLYNTFRDAEFNHPTVVFPFEVHNTLWEFFFKEAPTVTETGQGIVVTTLRDQKRIV